MKESRTKVRYAHIAVLHISQYATKEGHEPSCLEKFRFQHLWKDVSDKLSNEVAEQVYVRNKWDEACKRVKDSMPTPKSSFAP
ncbi:hypothetical protein ERO13_D11G222228v2 [Gossypium hirsutum]|nr:hypothetical protein ERO13_D11G222228v2 [Gossypium hirsutum]